MLFFQPEIWLLDVCHGAVRAKTYVQEMFIATWLVTTKN